MSDYGRDSTGCYKGNVQSHPEHELRGETQESIAQFFGKWSSKEDALLLVDLAARVALKSGATRDEIAFLLPASGRQHHLMIGDPGGCLLIQLRRFAASRRKGYSLDREVNKRMAELRDALGPGPFEHKAAWAKDADARKGAAGEA